MNQVQQARKEEKSRKFTKKGAELYAKALV